MNNDDLDKKLGDAMGDIGPQEQPAEPPPSTSKRTLKGPMVAAPVISEPVRESFEEMKLRAKLEVLEDLLREERAARRNVKLDTLKADETKEPEETVTFTVNLPVQATNLRVDGREYYHGHTYQIRQSQLASFLDMQFMAWKHDEQVRGYRPVAPGFSTGDMSINANGQAISRPIY